MACYNYQLKHDGKPRPKRLIEKHLSGSAEFCECNRPATHTVMIQIHDHRVEPMPLCDDCYAEHQRQVRTYGDGKLTGNLQQGASGSTYGDD